MKLPGGTGPKISIREAAERLGVGYRALYRVVTQDLDELPPTLGPSFVIDAENDLPVLRELTIARAARVGRPRKHPWAPSIRVPGGQIRDEGLRAGADPAPTGPGALATGEGEAK